MKNPNEILQLKGLRWSGEKRKREMDGEIDWDRVEYQLSKNLKKEAVTLILFNLFNDGGHMGIENPRKFAKFCGFAERVNDLPEGIWKNIKIHFYGLMSGFKGNYSRMMVVEDIMSSIKKQGEVYEKMYPAYKIQKKFNQEQAENKLCQAIENLFIEKLKIIETEEFKNRLMEELIPILIKQRLEQESMVHLKKFSKEMEDGKY